MKRTNSRRLETAARLMLPAGFMATVMASMYTTSEAQLPPPPPGGPLQGLTPTQLNQWDQGRLAFTRNLRPQDGLGPVFNGTSCVQCHAAGAPGGASPGLGVSIVTRIGGYVNGNYTDLENVGGALIQARSLREFIPTYPVPREVVPAQATQISHRQTTPVWGVGLMEAIPAAAILSRQDPNDANHDGISGRANMVFNSDTNVTEVGRFGWKNQFSSLHQFSADAFINEMGITSPLHPVETRPQGQPLPPGADQVSDPEDHGIVNAATDFMRFNAPPPAMPNPSPRGRALFTSIGCASCHTPTMTTAPSPVAALSLKPVNLYSDLLLHDMGTLGDGIRQGQATGTEFRTAPLWGLRFRRLFLHDGRATTLDQAIRLHGGEALGSVSRFNALPLTDRNELFNFLLGI